MTQLNTMKLSRVDVSAYSNNAIRKEDGRFYMVHEVDAEIDALKAENERLRKGAEKALTILQEEEEMCKGWVRDQNIEIQKILQASIGALPDTNMEKKHAS